MIQKNYLSVKWTIELLISFQCLLLYSVHAADSTTTCANGFSAYNGYCYRKTTTSTSWSSARVICQSHGADLATVHDAAESTYLGTLCSSSDGCHAGLTDATTEGTWAWIDGTTKTYTNWHSGEPNGGTGENCLNIYTDGTWNDISCGTSRYSLCSYISCSAGYYASKSNTCSQCSAGSYSSIGGLISCTQCPVGTYANLVGSTSCASCPIGTYSSTVGSLGCTQCTSGTYSNAIGSTTCAKCNAGTYSNTNTATSCTQCPVGTYSNSVGSTTCTKCAAGTYSNVAGSTTCTTCLSGSYASLAGLSSCTQCPIGNYFNSITSSCAPCPSGTYSNAIGATVCTSCPTGTFSNLGATVCAMCLNDPYFDEVSATLTNQKSSTATSLPLILSSAFGSLLVITILVYRYRKSSNNANPESQNIQFLKVYT